MPINKLAPVGGPRGYLYHLKRQLDKLLIDNIEFLPSENDEWIIERIFPFFKSIRISLNIVLSQYQAIFGFRHKAKIDLNRYDVIHFHDTFSMFSVRDSLKHYNGKIVLTSHSPTILSNEWKEEASKYKKKFCGGMLNRLIEMDEYAFNRADFLFFPCEDAEEPYFKSWDGFKEVKKLKADKFRYIPSGINPCFPKLTRKEVLCKYNIPQNAIVFAYAGRHSEIKGYDLLKKIGSSILPKYENVYFLIAGIEKPLTRLEHPRWIEAGWTNDPHSLIAASNAFILPNKETYFDLIMLETLSLGKIVIASNTGGNKYFRKFESDGIILFNDIQEAISSCERVIRLDNTTVMSLEQENRKMFNDNFTIDIFAKHYSDLVNNI